MSFPGGFDLGEMMRQAKEMSQQLERDLQELRVEASAGGGMVKCTMNGVKQLLELKIDSEFLKGGDAEMLADMVIAAVNEATRKVDEAVKGRLGGLNLPTGLI
jgi:DNA-binding YbaB/EbfC family protein